MNYGKKLQFVFFLVCVLFYSVSAQEYPKAILRGDYADPTILRDGEDFYMTHSSFFGSPGLLIWHSKDLVHWEPICRALSEQEGSVWAPDLVKFNNRYYIYYPTAAKKNWVIWADNIRGPWSKPIDLKVDMIDPGHSVGEDGKRYLHLSKGMMIQLADDGLSVIGEKKQIYTGWEYPKEWKTEGKNLESPKIVKHGEYFYLTTAEGGTAGPATSHMVVSARSKSIFGPWENSPYNPIVHTYSADEHWWSKGHGTIFDDAKGNWWIIYHAYENGAYPVGRQTLLEPIEWTADGWFKLAKTAQEPKNQTIKGGMELSDDFKGKKLGVQWMLWKNTDLSTITLKKKSLFLKAKGTTPKDAQLLLTTSPDKNYQMEVEVQIEEGSTGGLLLYYSEKAFAGITSDGKQFTIHETADKNSTTPNKYGNHFFVKIINTHQNCTMLVSGNQQTWDTLSTNVDVSAMHHNNYRGFFALRPALIAAGKGEVKYNNFVYTPQQGYLMAYFTDKNKNQNGLHLAWSRDGYKWNGIGDEYSFLKSDYGEADKEKRMRDPFLMKGADGLWHCIWTLNWNVNIIGHATSSDLIHWSEQQTIPIMQGYEAKNCWAPEMIYDEKKQEYLIFWSSTIKVNGEWKTEEGKKYDNRIYYSTTKDFKTFSPAKVFFDPKFNVIDATIEKVGKEFYMVYKDERELPTPHKNLRVAVSKTAQGTYKDISDKPFTKDWVEGPSICHLPDNSYLVYMDSYSARAYEAKRTTDFKSWEDVNAKISLPKGVKHASIVTTTLDLIDDLIFEQKRAEQSTNK